MMLRDVGRFFMFLLGTMVADVLVVVLFNADRPDDFDRIGNLVLVVGFVVLCAVREERRD